MQRRMPAASCAVVPPKGNVTGRGDHGKRLVAQGTVTGLVVLRGSAPGLLCVRRYQCHACARVCSCCPTAPDQRIRGLNGSLLACPLVATFTVCGNPTKVKVGRKQGVSPSTLAVVPAFEVLPVGGTARRCTQGLANSFQLSWVRSLPNNVSGTCQASRKQIGFVEPRAEIASPVFRPRRRGRSDRGLPNSPSLCPTTAGPRILTSPRLAYSYLDESIPCITPNPNPASSQPIAAVAATLPPCGLRSGTRVRQEALGSA